MQIKLRMTTKEIDALLKKHWEPINYNFAEENFEHRLESTSSSMIYSFIREYKPKNIVALGTSHGGSTCIIMSALIANKTPFKYLAAEKDDDLRKQTRKHVIEKCGKAPKLIGDLTKHDDYPDGIDFLFHDTDHDLETTQWVFENIMPKVKKDGLVVFHDWPVEEIDSEWIGKEGMWPETRYMLDLRRKGKLGLEKVYFNYELGTGLETGVFLKL